MLGLVSCWLHSEMSSSSNLMGLNIWELEDELRTNPADDSAM